VKVKRGLFSYQGEEHLPGQNDQSNMKSGIAAQPLEKTAFTKTEERELSTLPSSYPGQKTAQSCTLTAGHYLPEGTHG